jgi:hypothetical protein
VKRRDLLAGLGTAGTLALAGCAAEGDDPGDRPAETTEDATDRDPTTDTPDGDGPDDTWTPESETPQETVTVGDPETVAFPQNNGPHDLRVWNDAAAERSLSVTVVRGGESVLDRTFTLAADAWVQVRLHAPAGYDLSVSAGEVAGSLTVSRSQFDCNQSWTTVAVRETAVEDRTVSTAMGCPGPAVGETTFEYGEGGCGSTDRATVRFEEETVRIEGTAKTPVPCYDLALAGVELREADPAADDGESTLVVRVGAAGRQSGGCVECLGSVPYETTVAMDHAYPSQVRVVHEGPSGVRTVTETAR